MRQGPAALALLSALAWMADAEPALAQKPSAERPSYEVGMRWLLNDGAYDLIRATKDVYFFAAGPNRQIELTRDLGIAYVAYAPLGRSLLAGVVPDLARLDAGDTRGRHPRFIGENFAKNRALVERLDVMAEEKDCKTAQLALAWLVAQGPDVIPIPGTKQIARLEENLGALNVHLTPAELDRISAAIPIGAAAGTRYPEGGMRGVYI